MFKWIIGLFFCSAIICVSGNNGTYIPPEPSTSPATTTTLAPTTIPTTSSSTSTTSTTIITTTSSTTTTTTPSTTSTSTSTSTSTTTPVPSTTTIAPPKPTPTPPKTGKWIVNGTNYTCIIVSMSAQFNLTYFHDSNTTFSKEIIMPTDNASTTATGQCNENQQFVNISWKNQDNYTVSLALHFNKNETKYYSLDLIEFTVMPQLFNITPSSFLKLSLNTTEYKTALGNSYRCARIQNIKLTNPNKENVTGIFKVSDLQLQAFRMDKSTVFGFAEDCAFVTPDVVPIVVGCVLMVLIIVVLAAYLIGRRRSQARGYRSM